MQLSYGGTAQDLTVTSSYDAFGDLLTKTDWSGSRAIETDTYDIAGNELTSTDGYGIKTNNSYDCLGYLTASWQTASGTSQKNNYTATTYDPLDRALTITTKTSDSGGTLTTAKTVTDAYNGVGDELTSTDTTVGGQPEKWLYDDAGNVTEHWALGVYTTQTPAPPATPTPDGPSERRKHTRQQRKPRAPLAQAARPTTEPAWSPSRPTRTAAGPSMPTTGPANGTTTTDTDDGLRCLEQSRRDRNDERAPTRRPTTDRARPRRRATRRQ